MPVAGVGGNMVTFAILGKWFILGNQAQGQEAVRVGVSLENMIGADF